MILKKRIVIITEDSTQDRSIWFWHEMLSWKSEKDAIAIFINPSELIFKMTFEALERQPTARIHKVLGGKWVLESGETSPCNKMCRLDLILIDGR